MPDASIVRPRRPSWVTLAVPAPVETRAPKAARAARHARSPWPLARSSPRTPTVPPHAPELSQKAALDQSPSTLTAPPLTGRALPETR